MERTLHLARFFRAYRGSSPADGRDGLFLESLLDERVTPIDGVAHAILCALEERPRTTSELVTLFAGAPGSGASSEASPAPAGAVLHALGLLARVGAVSPRPEGASLAPAYEAFERTKTPIPVVDQVELTNHCPMTCPMCPTGAGVLTRPRGFMDRALFERLVRELEGHQPRWKPLALHNVGESTLHPELVELVALATARGVDTELAANPGFVSLERYRALAEAGLARLVLDVDGLDVATLEAVRGEPVRAAEAFVNLAAILEHRRRAPAERPALVLQMIRLPFNRHQHVLFLERYGDLGLLGVEAYLKDADANSPPSREPTADGRKLLSLGRAGEVTASTTTPSEEPTRTPSLCRAPWRSVVVLWDGRVVPCCHDPDAALVLGDLTKSTLAEIWAGEAVRALRERLVDGKIRRGEPCATCAHRPDRFVRPPYGGELPVLPLHW